MNPDGPGGIDLQHPSTAAPRKAREPVLPRDISAATGTILAMRVRCNHPAAGTRPPPGARRARRLPRVAAALCAALLSACSFDYSESGAAPEELLDYIPETELHDVTHTVVRDGRVVAQISAHQVQNFPRHGRTILIEVEYVEYDATGSAVTTGSAGRAVYYSAREDAELAGAIRLRSESQEVRLEAGSLNWEGKRLRLSSPAGQTVEIARDDGSGVRGAGLELDVRRRTVRFAGPVSGTLVIDSDAEE